MAPSRTMLSFPFGAQRFNFRVAGLAMRDNHVLVCREDDDDYVMLPGGRVELGEPSEMALRREMVEELHCEGAVERLVFTAEDFFVRDGETFHEIGLYYAISLPESFPFATGTPCFVTHDEGHELTFEWVETSAPVLERHNLRPGWIRSRMRMLPDVSEHMIFDERAHG